jgi:hypothetical protein
MPSTRFRTLREAILAQLTVEPQPIPAVIESALSAHAMTGGRTPRVTAAARISDLVRTGLAVRPARGMVALRSPVDPAARSGGARRRQPNPLPEDELVSRCRCGWSETGAVSIVVAAFKSHTCIAA